MKYAVLLALSVIAMFAVLIAIVTISAPTHRVYDCSLAEFHPDYPPQVREQCRLIRSSKLT